MTSLEEIKYHVFFMTDYGFEDKKKIIRWNNVKQQLLCLFSSQIQ